MTGRLIFSQISNGIDGWTMFASKVAELVPSKHRLDLGSCW